MQITIENKKIQFTALFFDEVDENTAFEKQWSFIASKALFKSFTNCSVCCVPISKNIPSIKNGETMIL